MKPFRPLVCGALLVSCLFGTAACGNGTPAITSEKVRISIAEELPVGASGADIESFFKRHNIDFGWNRFEGIYNGVIRDVEPFHGITLRVLVDSEKRSIRAEVRDAYTAQ